MNRPLNRKAFMVILCALALPGIGMAEPILRLGDAILAVDEDSPTTASSNPANEGPANVLDTSTISKYLNNGMANAGLIVTPNSGPSVIQSVVLTTANDFEERDPASIEIYGTNDAIVSANHSTGTDENWTLIMSSELALPATRQTAAPAISFANSTSYTSYKIIFPTVKLPLFANSMQIAGIALYQTPDATGTSVFASGGAAVAIDADLQYGRYTGAEHVAQAIGGNTTRYRNVGAANSGFIVTPWVGPSVVTSFVITTAPDTENQDPAGYVLYGTNAPIASTDNSQGNAENWTMISSGALSLPTGRATASDPVTFTNATAYMSYKMVFTSLKGAEAATAMQIGEFQFDGTLLDAPPLSLLQPGNVILAIDEDNSGITTSNYPAAEGPTTILDGVTTSKYLNFGETDSGFIVTPAAGSSVIRSMVLTTANDSIERDPASFILWGTNEPIASTNNSFGEGENWTLIASGPLDLPLGRMLPSLAISFGNEASYTSYKMVFPMVRDAALANSMQIADVGFYTTTDGTGPNILAVGDAILAIDRDSGPSSSTPAAEGVTNAIDGTLNKYLNQGRFNTGIIVTPAGGLTNVAGFRIVTANDFPARDPASFFLYGTNDTIISTNHSRGNKENWTLIATGEINLPVTRYLGGAMIEVANQEVYTSYKIVFPTLRDAVFGGSMQLSEIQFYGSIGLPCPMPFADADYDGDVDQIDFGMLQACLDANGSSFAPQCRCFNRNDDSDVDSEDLGEFLLCVTGPGIEWSQNATPDCLP